MLKKIFVMTLLAGVFLFAFPVFSLAAGLSNAEKPPADVLAEANALAKRIGGLDSDFFTETNETGNVLRYGKLVVPGGASVNYLVWGPWHSDPGWDGEGATKKDRSGVPRARYIGYGRKGERVSNVFFPPDRSGGWRRLDEAEFVEKPWENKDVRLAFPQFFGADNNFDGKDDPDLIKAMRAGLWWSAYGNEFLPPGPSSDLYQNPQKYVHVFLPMSSRTWGMGVMFHRDPDGSLWYRSVPLAKELPLPDDAISLVPAERIGSPGEKVSFTLNTSWSNGNTLKELFGCFGIDFSYVVRVSHLAGGSNNAPAFTLDGAKGNEATPGWSELVFDGPPDSAAKHGTVEVAVQDAPSEVVAQIVPCIKYRDTGEVFLLTGSYLFKEARAKVRPNLPNLKVTAITLSPGTGQEGRGEVGLEAIFERALRQQPDRLVVSECRSLVTAHYTLQAMGIGHPGSMSTIHAEGPEEVPARLDALLGGGSLHRTAAVEVVFFLAQLRAGDGMPVHRRLTDICEVRGKGDGAPEVAPLFAFDFRGYAESGEPLGELKPAGNRPGLLGKRKLSLFLTPGERDVLEKFFG